MKGIFLILLLLTIATITFGQVKKVDATTVTTDYIGKSSVIKTKIEVKDSIEFKKDVGMFMLLNIPLANSI